MKKLIIFISSILFAKELIFYCGITMAKDMEAISEKFEKKYNVNIKIIPGASKELLLTIKNTKSGDLYLPGASKYVLNNKNLFLYYKLIGFNQLVLVKDKNNKYTFSDILRNKVGYILCNYKTSSCGRVTKKFIEKKYGKEKYWELFDNAVEIAMDSKPLNRFVAEYKNYIGINWKGSVKNKDLKTEDIGAKKEPLYLAVVNIRNTLI